MKTSDSKIDIYLMALESLSKSQKQEIIKRLLEDPQIREDILDLAIISQRKEEPSRPFREFLAESKKRSLKE
jgi:hypothetical protein